MTTRTFKEWSAIGYRIIKGSKSVGRNDRGEPLFSDRQVSLARWPTTGRPSGGYSRRRGGISYYPDYDMEADAEMAEFFGISPWGLD